MVGRNSTRLAIEIGRKMAASAVARRRQAARQRKRILAEIAADRLRRAARDGRPFDAALRGGVTAGALVAEGDSWFDYPFHDVLKNLEDLGYEVEKVAHRGDTVEDMAYSDGQLDEFVRSVEKTIRTWGEPKAILLSGGGNDVAGDEFAMLLNHRASGIAGINDSIVRGVIDQRVREAYLTILGAITGVCERLLGHPVRIIIHGYGYPVPDGRGAYWKGPWLEPGLIRKGYDAIAQGRPMLVTLIDRFNDMLARLPRERGLGHVRYLDLRPLLPNGPSVYKQWWANELHPSKRGFDRITQEFASAIAAL